MKEGKKRVEEMDSILQDNMRLKRELADLRLQIKS